MPAGWASQTPKAAAAAMNGREKRKENFQFCPTREPTSSNMATGGVDGNVSMDQRFYFSVKAKKPK